jgi:hypothetical protein
MKHLTEEDRKKRHEWLLSKPVAKEEGNTGFGANFYTRQPHASFDLRAKNDIVTSYIVDKFSLGQPRNRSIEKPGENYDEQRYQREQSAIKERQESRKRQEVEVARVLDLQVKSAQTEKQI